MGAPDVVGGAEIAAMLGVTKKRVDQLVQQKDFPEGKRLTMGWVWSTADVEEWIARRRPPKPEG